MKTSLMKTIGGACACVCAMLCTGVAWGDPTYISFRPDQSPKYIQVGSTKNYTGTNFNWDLATNTDELPLASMYNSKSYVWYCYPGSYSLLDDLTLSLWSFGIYLDTTQTTYDFSGKTLTMGSAGLSFVSSTAANKDVNLTYKGGTWDFRNVTGSGGKLVGNGAESMIEKPKDTSTGVATTDKTKWYTSGKYTKQHGVVDGATIYKPNCSFYLFGGNINSTLEFKNSAQFTSEQQVFLSHYTLDSITFGAGGNTLTIGGGSQISCSDFYTDTSTSVSTVPLSVKGKVIVTGSATDSSGTVIPSSLDVTKTLYLGALVGGNTIQVMDGAYVKASTGGSGSGICLGVNNANSCSNTLEIADGGHVTIGSDTTKLSLSIGHSNGSIGNKVIVRKGGSLTASYVKLDQSGSLTSGYNGDDNSFIAEAGSTVSLSANVPFYLYGNNSKISLATGNGSATTAWSYGTVFDMTAKVSKETDSTTGNTTYTLQGCTNNTLEILSRTTFNVTRELKLGEQHDSTKVTYPYVPSIGSTIVVGNDATLNVASQVFCAGPRNTLVLSNGTLNCKYENGYAFYWGDTRCVTLGQGWEGNKIVLYGNKPQLKTVTEVCTYGYPCISFGGTTEIDVNLPETLAYGTDGNNNTIIPFVCGRFVLEDGCRFKIPNIATILSKMAENSTASATFTLVEATSSIDERATTTCASELPAGCALSISTDSNSKKHLVLTVTYDDAVCSKALNSTAKSAIGEAKTAAGGNAIAYALKNSSAKFPVTIDSSYNMILPKGVGLGTGVYALNAAYTKAEDGSAVEASIMSAVGVTQVAKQGTTTIVAVPWKGLDGNTMTLGNLFTAESGDIVNIYNATDKNYVSYYYEVAEEVGHWYSCGNLTSDPVDEAPTSTTGDSCDSVTLIPGTALLLTRSSNTAVSMVGTPPSGLEASDIATSVGTSSVGIGVNTTTADKTVNSIANTKDGGTSVGLKLFAPKNGGGTAQYAYKTVNNETKWVKPGTKTISVTDSKGTQEYTVQTAVDVESTDVIPPGTGYWIKNGTGAEVEVK